MRRRVHASARRHTNRNNELQTAEQKTRYAKQKTSTNRQTTDQFCDDGALWWKVKVATVLAGIVALVVAWRTFAWKRVVVVVVSRFDERFRPHVHGGGGGDGDNKTCRCPANLNRALAHARVFDVCV